jgi:hypothetical protein
MVSWRRWGRRIVRAALALTAALVLLVGVVRANARYLYCPMMNAIVSHTCCASPSVGEASGEPAVQAPDCCETMQLGALPSAAGVPSHEASTSPLVATLPSCVATSSHALRVRSGRSLETLHRATPKRGEARARTMVFLI